LQRKQPSVLTTAMHDLQRKHPGTKGKSTEAHTCIKIGLPAAAAAAVLPAHADVASLSRAVRLASGCRCFLQPLPDRPCRRRVRAPPARVLPDGGLGACDLNRFAALQPEERCPDTAGDVAAGPGVAPRRPPVLPAAGDCLRLATWNATALTEHKVHELLDKAAGAATLVVAV
jgi:hypothetical protein